MSPQRQRRAQDPRLLTADEVEERLCFESVVPRSFESLFGEHVGQLGGTVREVWSRLLRRPDRFVTLDSAVFLDAQVTSADYVDRYGGVDPVVCDDEGSAGGTEVSDG